MNIFFLDQDPKLAAQYHCDKHIVKMVLESAQILSTIHRLNGLDEGYKITHRYHPCTVWAGKFIENYQWLRELISALNQEYRYRYYRQGNHMSYNVVSVLSKSSLPSNGGTISAPALAMPDECKIAGDPVASYRAYYKSHKADIAKWSRRQQPEWW